MASVINSNIPSLNAQRNLSTSQSSLNTSIQRLSSGLRINSAKDDAAGLAISQRMTSQINGMNQAIRNANDGISLVQTAESAMGSVGDTMQRIRELALQSANASNSKTDREALQKEVTQLKSEIDRVADQTEFNGTKLVNGTFNGAAFQVGANAGQTITIGSVTDLQTKSMGKAQFATSAAATLTSGAGGSAIGNDYTINGVPIDAVAASTVAAGPAANKAQAEAIAKAINAKYDETGVYATLGGTDGNELKLNSTRADKDIVITGTGPTPGTLTAAAATADTVKTLNIDSFVGAQRAISIASKALDGINTGRADLGAIQNRFTSAISNLQSSSENLSAARSRIVDADFAAETANMTRNQILQQAGTAMLSQANQLPNSVMSLLRG